MITGQDSRPSQMLHADLRGTQRYVDLEPRNML